MPALRAKALFIARSTFLSRMEQIVKLTQVDLSDWKVCLYLMLSYEFYEMEDHAANKKQ